MSAPTFWAGFGLASALPAAVAHVPQEFTQVLGQNIAVLTSNIPASSGSALTALGAVSSGFLVAGVFSRLKDALTASIYRKSGQLEKSVSDLQATCEAMRQGRNLEARWHAAQALSETREGRDFLIEALKHHDPIIRSHAVCALASTEDSRAVPSMIDILTSEDKAYERLQALNFLEDNVRDLEDLLEPLIATLKRKTFRHSYDETLSNETEEQAAMMYEMMIRESAAQLLGNIGGPRALDALIEALLYEDESMHVHTHVLLSLEKIGERRAEKPLEEFLKKGPRSGSTHFNDLPRRVLESLRKRH